MKQLLTTLIAFICFNTGYGQLNPGYKQIGYLIDNKGQRIFDYCDFDYVPEKPIKVEKFVKWEFSPGYYYDSSNKRIDGYLKIVNMSVYYRKTLKGSSQALNIDACKGFVISGDSFAVAPNPGPTMLMYIYNNLYLEVVEQMDGFTLYRFDKNNGVNYFFKADTSASIKYIPSGYLKYKEFAGNLFASFPILKDKILSGKYSYSDLPSLVRIFKYKQYFDKKQRVFYNSFWDETKDSLTASFYGEIISLQDSVFRMKHFFRDGTPLHEGAYTSFYPHRRTGIFNWFYPDGKIRKTILYRKNDPVYMQIFYNNGQLHYDIRLEDNDLIYNQIFDQKGNAQINNSGLGMEVYYDSVNHRPVTFTYHSRKLRTAFYTDSLNRKIYVHCEQQAEPKGLKIKPENYPEKSLMNSQHGIALVRLLVDPSGVVSKYKIVKGVSPDIDSLILQTFAVNITEKKFIAAKSENKNVFQEMLLPFDFSMEGFSMFKNHYNYLYRNDIMFHHWHMQQMQQMQQRAQMNRVNDAIRNSGFR